MEYLERWYIVSHILELQFFSLFQGIIYNESGKIINKIWHVWDLLLLHISLYVIDFIAEKIILFGNNTYKDDVVFEILSCFSTEALKNAVLWSRSIFGLGQWFIIALLEGYLVIYLIYKLQMGAFFEKHGATIATILLAVHIIVRVVLIKLQFNMMFEVDLYQTWIVRNVWFDAIPFLLIGLSLHYYKSIGKLKDLSVERTIFLSLVALFLSIGEMALTQKYIEPKIESVLYVGTVVSVILAFVLAIEYPQGKKNLGFHVIEFVGKNLSMTVYFIHVIVAHFLNAIIENTRLYYFWQGIFPILVIIVTVLIAYLIFKYKEHAKGNSRNNKFIVLLVIMCIGLNILPSTRNISWNLLYETCSSTRIIVDDKKFQCSTVMITIQNMEGITINEQQIPVQQFMGGGFEGILNIGQENYTYDITYSDNSYISIVIPDDIVKLRIWVC